MACKYRFLIRDTNLSLPLIRLINIQLLSRFYAFYLPTAIGPEAVRWYKVTKNKEEKSFFLAATFYERVIFLLVLFGFGMLPLFYYDEYPQIVELRTHTIPLAIFGIAILLLGLLYLLLPTLQEFVKKFLKKTLMLKNEGRVDLFLTNLVLKDRSLFLFLRLLFLTICWQFILIIRIFFLFKSMGLFFGVIEAAWMGSLVLLLQILPISFAGIGIREGAYAYLFTLFDLPSEQGFLIGILFFTQMLIFGSIGAVLNIFEKV